MSGIVAILHEDGKPVDQDLLWSLTNYMRFRGPDEQRVWCEGAIGLGHTMLRTTDEMIHEQQPMTLDGEVWITADARIDDRDTLRRKLESHDRALVEPVTDVALILHAYAVWEEECVHHLLGDFAFVIWDGRRRRLFCARDHFGVKPFFYVIKSGCLLVSNTLNCLRSHPLVSNELDRNAINSFLARGYNEYPYTSAFVDIRRLSPAQSLLWSDNDLRLNTYWTIPIEEPLRYKNPTEYVEEFRELLSIAVHDRIRTDKAAVTMSGGLDSTTIAALARRVSPKEDLEIQAFTGIPHGRIGNDERSLAQSTADHLRIGVEFYETEDPVPFTHWSSSNWNSPEPSLRLISKRGMELFSSIPNYSRVLLTGYGGDPVLFPSQTYLISLAKKGRIGQLMSDIRQYYGFRHRIPPLYIRTALRRMRANGSEIAKQIRKRDRKSIPSRKADAHIQITVPAEKAQEHPWRQEAVDRLDSTWWATLFEGYDAGGSGFLVESRHPFFDLRLVRYALRLPSVPWCVQKEIMRQAMVDLLPPAIVHRPKATLPGDYSHGLIKRVVDEKWVRRIYEVPSVASYIDIELAVSQIVDYSRGGYLVPG